MAQMAGFGQRAHRTFLSIASGRTKIPGIACLTPPSSSGVVSSPKKDDCETEVAKSSGEEARDLSSIAGIGSCSDDEISKESKPLLAEFASTQILIADSDAGALTLPDGDEESCRMIANQAISMLSTLFPPELVGGVLLQVVAGRFNFLNHNLSVDAVSDKTASGDK